MARSESILRNIGRNFGSKVEDFSLASRDIIENIVLEWCNEGLKLMKSHIQRNVRTGVGSKLAQSLSISPKKITPTEVIIDITSDLSYWKYRDLGVKGVKNKSKAPNSPFKFKNLGTPIPMIDSFKSTIARTGLKTFNNKRIVSKNKNKQGNAIDKAAKQMAIRTKIGGIAPLNFSDVGYNKKRNKELSRSLMTAIGSGIKANIIKGF